MRKNRLFILGLFEKNGIFTKNWYYSMINRKFLKKNVNIRKQIGTNQKVNVDFSDEKMGLSEETLEFLKKPLQFSKKNGTIQEKIVISREK